VEAAVRPAELFDTALPRRLCAGPPVIYFRRSVTHDTELRRAAAESGRQDTVWYPSANRDDDIFDNPFDFDIGRDPNPHIGFGGRGPHFCLGANLAGSRSRRSSTSSPGAFPTCPRSNSPAAAALQLHPRIKHLPVEWSADAT